MKLTAEQLDAVTELMNIAFARAGSALSQIINQRVLLDVPKIAVHRMSEVIRTLPNFVNGELASVHQIFTGAFSGDAMLLLNTADASRLTDLLTEQKYASTRLDASAREVLTEVGNILLNACLGMFGNVLDVHISFSVPQLQLEMLDGLIRSLSIDNQELRYALVTSTEFQLRDEAVRGVLVIVLGVTSLENLVKAVDQWALRSVPAPAGSGPISAKA